MDPVGQSVPTIPFAGGGSTSERVNAGTASAPHENPPLGLQAAEAREAGSAPLSLAPSAGPASPFGTIPTEVVSLVAGLLAYPDQVALAAASKNAHQIVNTELSYL